MMIVSRIRIEAIEYDFRDFLSSTKTSRDDFHAAEKNSRMWAKEIIEN